ncbi:MAG: hypothetical protein AB7S75_22080 [Desulfococcaceae bacterium]
MKINIPVQFTGTGQKLEAFDTLAGYSFLEITLRRIVILTEVSIRNILKTPDSGFCRNDGKYSRLPDSEGLA